MKKIIGRYDLSYSPKQDENSPKLKIYMFHNIAYLLHNLSVATPIELCFEPYFEFGLLNKGAPLRQHRRSTAKNKIDVVFERFLSRWGAKF